MKVGNTIKQDIYTVIGPGNISVATTNAMAVRKCILQQSEKIMQIGVPNYLAVNYTNTVNVRTCILEVLQQSEKIRLEAQVYQPTQGYVDGKHSVSTLQLGPYCMWLILFGGGYCKADTVIIELSEC